MKLVRVSEKLESISISGAAKMGIDKFVNRNFLYKLYVEVFAKLIKISLRMKP